MRRDEWSQETSQNGGYWAVEELLWLCVGSLPGLCSSAHSLEAALAPYDSDV